MFPFSASQLYVLANTHVYMLAYTIACMLTCLHTQTNGQHNWNVLLMQANCSIAGNIVIRILQYRASGGGYIQLTFLNIIGGIDSVLLSASKANVSD